MKYFRYIHSILIGLVLILIIPYPLFGSYIHIDNLDVVGRDNISTVFKEFNLENSFIMDSGFNSLYSNMKDKDEERFDILGRLFYDQLDDNVTDKAVAFDTQEEIVYQYDEYGNIIYDELDDNVTIDMVDEFFDDIFIYSGIELSLNIPSTFFFRAKLIHNSDKSGYEKQREFMNLTSEAIEAFYSYTLDFKIGARDISHAEDELQAMLAYLDIIVNNDHGYRELHSREELDKITEIFEILDEVVKMQMRDDMANKGKVIESVYEYPLADVPYDDEIFLSNYFPRVIFNEAKKIHTSNFSYNDKRILIGDLLRLNLDTLLTYVYDLDTGSRDIEESNIDASSILTFVKSMKLNDHGYGEGISTTDMKKMDTIIEILEDLFGIKERKVEYL